MSLRVLTDEESKQIQKKTLAALQRESFITNSYGSLTQVLLVADTNGIDLQVIDFSDAETMAMALSVLPKKTWAPTSHDLVTRLNNSTINAHQWRIEKRYNELWDYLKEKRELMSLALSQGDDNNDSVAIFRSKDDSVTHILGKYDELQQMFPMKRGENLVVSLSVNY